jgi:diguanylate cyclase (GGDEF)-like protein
MRADISSNGSLPRILLVEDNALERRLIRKRLRLDEVTLIEAADGKEALDVARNALPELILLDVDLPLLDGFEVLHQLKKEPATRCIPVIFLSGRMETTKKVRALDLGAVDYVTKPFDPEELRARIRMALRLKFYQDLLEKQAHLDALTGLANRYAFETRLATEWAACVQNGSPLSLLIVDLDHFKRINDSFGHIAGDETLRHTAVALQAVARSSDLLTRFGGEEFVLIAPDCHLFDAIAIGERAREQVESIKPRYNGVPFPITASVGVATITPSRIDPDATPLFLLNHADRALYEAKSAGRNTVWAWSPELRRATWGPLLGTMIA